MAVTQHDSIFKSIDLPGGISTKATEFKDLAAKGEKWESPVFGIGSAKESNDIPKLAPVTRKPHNAAPGSVRGSAMPSTGGKDDLNAASLVNNQGVSANTGSPRYSSTNGNPSGAFSNQVDQAFNMKEGQTNGPPGGIL